MSIAVTAEAPVESVDRLWYRGGRCECARLSSAIPTDTETDGINLNDFDDVLSSDGALLDDPLAVTPSEATTSEEAAPESDDPLASDRDPQ